jgi:2-polyprenyl-6-methoxyphenol hydroxylase-like FAD-dependent oxidoreductase
MADHYDVVVIGGGLGGLTAAALVAQTGRKTLLIERNHEIGGAASTYRTGDLVVEASLHETSDPCDPIDPKHHVLARLGVLDDIEWVPTRSVYEVRGGLATAQRGSESRQPPVSRRVLGNCFPQSCSTCLSLRRSCCAERLGRGGAGLAGAWRKRRGEP